MGAPKKPKPARASLRSFARAQGVSVTAVMKAVRSGRLSKSIGRDKQGPHVLDMALAAREWGTGASKPANRGASKRVPTPPRSAAALPAAAPAPSAAPAGGSLVEAQLRLADERRRALELTNLRKRGELLDAATVQREYFEMARITRERILNVPDRLSDLGPAVRARLREELRQALGAIADELDPESRDGRGQ